MGFTWTRAAIEEMTWRTLEGERAPVIAAALGCVARTVELMQCEVGLRLRRVRKPWAEKEIGIVLRRYADESTDALAKDLGRTVSMIYNIADKMGLKKSEAYLASPEACRLRRGDNVGAAYRYRKGQTPPNKGLRRPGWVPGRMASTQFKRGERSGLAAKNWKPIGTILEDHEGYLRIKVREWHAGENTGFGNTEIWPLLHRHTWVEHNGAIPAGHNVVFKDGKRSNCEIGNLELITRAEMMRRNTIHARYPPELKRAIMLLGAVKRKVRENGEKLNDGSA